MTARAIARAIRAILATLRTTEFWCGVAHGPARHFRRNVGNDWVTWCASCARERTEYGHEVSGW